MKKIVLLGFCLVSFLITTVLVLPAYAKEKTVKPVQIMKFRGSIGIIKDGDSKSRSSETSEDEALVAAQIWMNSHPEITVISLSVAEKYAWKVNFGSIEGCGYSTAIVLYRTK